jgi:Fe-S cluster assembly protein SufD
LGNLASDLLVSQAFAFECNLYRYTAVTHTMVQAQSRGAVHTRATYLTQAEDSHYALAEINLGGKLGRHELSIEQLGARTNTELACFILAGAGQCLDLHSAVTLDHEEGKTNQIHKCIVSAATGKGVFDGNVKVNKLAQRTDAGQISRNLLLVPKATVNVKPNLQIVADDVVCTHGCTVSDLEEEELFYIQSRGLSPSIARSLLVAGFGLEIVSKVSGKDLKERIAVLIKDSMAKDNVVLAV